MSPTLPSVLPNFEDPQHPQGKKDEGLKWWGQGKDQCVCQRI